MTLTKREQDRLLTEHFGTLARFATVFWHKNKHTELDECKSVAMLAAVEAVGNFDPDCGAKFSTWIHTIVNRRLLNHVRDSRVSRGPVDYDTDGVEAAFHDEDGIEGRIDDARLRTRMTDGAPILSRYLMGHTFTDIAKAESVDKSTVSRRAAKETNALRDILAPDRNGGGGKVNNGETALEPAPCPSSTHKNSSPPPVITAARSTESSALKA